MIDFKEFPKMSRLSREMIITEKIDGTNASIFIQNRDLEPLVDDSNGNMVNIPDPHILSVVNGYTIRAGSRTRWITPSDDNYGFGRWVYENREELIKLEEGHHFGEWWGNGIQRSYGLPKGEKRFSLFNVSRWKIDSYKEAGFQAPPRCCHIVPILYQGMFNTDVAQEITNQLAANGSYAAPGFKNPEGIVVWHTAGNFGFKKTIHKDELHKSQINEQKTI